ncbi:zinc-dependent alcohol dehydrogenase family protein [Rhodococcus sp. 077-4]|uniref:zinc-dependent alcohol dehydrogenase family protein n=1 Tax=Rhodococcus sp. 077-4 TaxID=2789271 RepID=UPI0039F4CF15
MKSVQLTDVGDPSSVYRLHELPDIDSNDIAADEVLVDIDYAPINHNDLMLARVPGLITHFPAQVGNEGTGVVAALGKDVTSVAVGQRVLLPHSSGTWRQQIAVQASNLVIVPPEIDPQQAAMLTINAATAEFLLRDYGLLQPGDAVVFNAATSGLARWLLALASKRDVRTIGIVRRADDIAALEALGCDVVIDVNDGAQAALERVTDLNIALALDLLGGESSRLLAKLLAPGGVLVTYGNVTGDPLAVDTLDIVSKDLTIRGFYQAYPRYFADTPRVVEHTILPILATTEVVQPVAAVYPLRELSSAIEHAASGARVLLDLRR